MFVWQCLKTKGKHLGMCMDGFMFGSCCLYPEDGSSSITDEKDIEKIDNTIATTLTPQKIAGSNPINQWANVKKNPVYISPATTSPPKKQTTTETTKTTVIYVRPTRPTRPAKPGIKWPPPTSSDFHLLQQSVSSSENDSNKKTANNYHQHTVQILKPTKSPPIKTYNKFGSSKYTTISTKSTVTEATWVWTKVSNSGETLELPHKNIPHVRPNKPLKGDSPTTNKYFPSTGASSSVNLNSVDDYETSNRRPVRPTRPARPPKPSQIITYFPGGSLKPTPSSNYVSRNTTSKFTLFTTPSFIQKTSSTIFPIIIRRTTKTPPTKFAPTTSTTPKSTTRAPLPVFHTVKSPGDLSTTTASTARPVSVPALSASSRSGSCGLPQIKQFCPKGRIVNGTQSCYGQFPWQVSLCVCIKGIVVTSIQT